MAQVESENRDEKNVPFQPGLDPLPGFPGYRMRDNRSGLDPIDTRTESAHMGGTFLRGIFTLKAKTRNPFYLVLMFIFGVVPFPILTWLLFTNNFFQSSSSFAALIYVLIAALVCGALALNFFLSLAEMTRFLKTQKSKHKKRRCRTVG